MHFSERRDPENAFYCLTVNHICVSPQTIVRRSRFKPKRRSSHVILKIAPTPWRVLCTFNPLSNDRTVNRSLPDYSLSTRSTTVLIVEVASPKGRHEFVSSFSAAHWRFLVHREIQKICSPEMRFDSRELVLWRLMGNCGEFPFCYANNRNREFPQNNKVWLAYF